MTESPDRLAPSRGAGTAVATPSAVNPPRASGLLIFAYFFAQFGNWLVLLAPVVITIAIRVIDVAAVGGLTDAEKATQLGYVLGAGALASTISTPIWGALSDRTTARMGRRKPWMLIGLVGGSAGFVLMAWGPNMVVLGIGWVIAQLGFNANQAALNALLPDAIAEEQRGRVSGLLGLTATLGILGGTFITQFTTGNYFVMFLLPALVAGLGIALLCVVFRDRPARRGELPRFTATQFFLSFWVNPRTHRDFGWAFFSRFLVFFGNAFLTVYGVYFLTDHLNVGPAEIVTVMFYSVLINAALIVSASLLSGWLSDLVRRRKPFVWAAAIVMGIGLTIAGTSSSVEMYVVGAAVAALGGGVYFAIDLALVAAVLPDHTNTAKYLGVIQIANTLPQSLAPIMAPALLAIGAAGGSGNYPAVYIAGAIFALIGAAAVLPIRSTR